jgi:dTDP-4-amino-4,6-dideoxygalactose transaminase
MDAGPDIPVFDVLVTADDVAAVRAALDSGGIGSGGRVEQFEREFASHLGVEHVVALSSCTAALHVACLAAGVGPGDEVIIPALTFVATAAAVRYSGGVPVFCDIESTEELQIDPDAVAGAIGDRTKAVLAVHFAGYPAAAQRLRAICDAAGVAFLEDAAHVPVASLDGRAPGTFGLAGCFSFFSNKVLACGEGGALSTDDPEIAALARAVRGGASPYRGELGPALNYRLDEARAALLLSRWARLGEEIETRRQLASRYFQLLAGLDSVRVPFSNADLASSSGYLMIVLVDPARRREIRAKLLERHGIQTTIFPALHELSAYRALDPTLRLPLTEEVARSHIVLPLFPHMTEPQQDRVVESLALATGS